MRIPSNTYRLQITSEFDLFTAAGTVGYLHALGVDWLYLSPLLTAQTGSPHGYDVADHATLDPARGGAAGLARLAAEAHRLGMGIMVDIVPNHIGVARPWESRWWWDLLANGQQSRFADAFDVDWPAADGRLRLPVVVDDDLLPDGRIAALSVVDGELRYRDQRFPLAPGSLRAPGDDPQAVHDRQHYALVSWRMADADLNYRRFFAVNSLAAIRVEDPAWFAESHTEIRRWFDEGLVDGLRVDHPDGLRDPGRYLDALAELTGGGYVLVEKILALRLRDGAVDLEELPTSWATCGTTGYEAMALIDRVLVDPAGEEPLTALEDTLRGHPVDWEQLVHDRKLAVAQGGLNSETRRIAREVLAGLAPTERPAVGPLVDAIAELLADFPVYRSYLPLGRADLDHAVARARAHRPDLGTVLDLLERILSDPATPPSLRFQQTSGMVTAKGVEDCSFYRWSRLTSLNDVGGEPGLFAVDVPGFHALMAHRQQQWPAALTAGTTHDTKRGEDTRARISALAEVPQLWQDALTALLGLVPVPDPGFANLLWQAVVGTWPAESARLHGYVTKAMREAGEHTTWTAPEPRYEEAMQACVDAALGSAEVADVLRRVLDVVVPAGRSNALAAKLLDLTIPGVPDVYQGSELWELSLVDPDNRRPVDFVAREGLLAQLRAGARPRLTDSPDDAGAAKLLVTTVGLTLRRDRRDLFTGYTPVAARGPASRHVLAFDRGGAVTVVTRLPVGLARAGGWRDTAVQLPEGGWRDLITGREVDRDHQGDATLHRLLADYPVALLVR